MKDSKDSKKSGGNSPSKKSADGKKKRKGSKFPDWISAEFADSTEQALLAALLDDPKDDRHRQVYADWLEDRGSAGSEFLRLKAREASLGTEERERLQQLRGKLSPIWLLAIGDTLDCARPLVEKVAAVGTDGRNGGGELKLKYRQGLLDVHFLGNLSGETREEVLRWLASHEVSSIMRSLVMDEFGNMTRYNGFTHIELGILAESPFPFDRLERLELDRGLCYVASRHGSSDEAGLFAELLSKAPALKELVIPGAPSGEFFVGPPHPLEKLIVDGGNAHQNFIENLAGSKRFARLRHFEYQEDQDWPNPPTPVEAFEALLRSPAIAGVERIQIASVALTDDDIKRLRAIRKKGVKFTEPDLDDPYEDF